MLVKTREQFYHPVTGRLPNKRAEKGTPFRWPVEKLGLEALPLDAVIVEGTDEQKAELKALQDARRAQIKQAKADGQNAKQLESMRAFQVAMQAMMGAMQQQTVAAQAAPVKVNVPAQVAADTDDDGDGDDEPKAAAPRRRRRSA